MQGESEKAVLCNTVYSEFVLFFLLDLSDKREAKAMLKVAWLLVQERGEGGRVIIPAREIVGSGIRTKS